MLLLLDKVILSNLTEPLNGKQGVEVGRHSDRP